MAVEGYLPVSSMLEIRFIDSMGYERERELIIEMSTTQNLLLTIIIMLDGLGPGDWL